MIAHEGVVGLWRGLGASLLRDVPFSGFYWTSYESLKKYYGAQNNPGFGFSFFAGAASGAVS